MAFVFGFFIGHDTWVCNWPLFECFYVNSSVRNLCCDSAIAITILPLVGGWGKGRGRDMGSFSTKTVSMLGSCFEYLWF